MIAEDRVGLALLRLAHEQLLHVGRRRARYRHEAAAALADPRRRDRSGDDHTTLDRLQGHLEVDQRTVGHA